MNEIRCEHCVFWSEHTSDLGGGKTGYGDCRHRSPVKAVMHDGCLCEPWPSVSKADFCGDFKVKSDWLLDQLKANPGDEGAIYLQEAFADKLAKQKQRREAKDENKA